MLVNENVVTYYFSTLIERPPTGFGELRRFCSKPRIKVFMLDLFQTCGGTGNVGALVVRKELWETPHRMFETLKEGLIQPW